MDFEPWWLIFVPVLFALGWLAARFDIRQMLRETRSLPDSYFRGLNFLLNEEPDRAIDAFVEVAKLDPETTELHFALGSLFRRRGEMERAIRVHQSLLNRSDLPAAEREHAQHELAQDFLKAGMLDRAENGFEQLKDTRYALPALRSLIRIYESEHDWPRAIEAVKTLQGLVDEPVPQLVHYYCEQAQTALSAKPADIDAAHKALDAADHALSTIDPASSKGAMVRTAMLRARLALIEQDPKRERLYLESIMTDAPEYAGLVAEQVLANYRAANQEAAGLDVLQKQYARHASLDLFNVLFRELRAQQGAATSWAFARNALRSHPSLLGLDRLLEAELANPESGAEQAPVPGADLTLLRSLIHKHTQRLDRYACRSCGFQARRFYWQCPGCNAWETYAPRRLEELE
ncbi:MULTISPECIES: lipopolysaccharide assembly protein LapB [Achromobacter]|uniref:Lipopolysaccharide assembly protein B n=1 Tax=Alcaligenes xylosoxydans xylosoxydans TaxID=85698 RepID=A0A424W9H4_ALCXX|nr:MULTISPECIES: lipopolysaccharide assembly protein LapB [Achromobacter]MBC9905217.1 lipopolysaccharide assembly protein LapB [Achromobacter xylosoxidans]MBD0871126.1 lipopolysaccharide assembly protein LapB [Achromobacter xylosoxidans]MDH1303374.1 lipopolysaccharide assembly protein LapB [Achromobacter sp. GD03932]QNP84366.1 lipopolysaccharide assembly protein LapB [Achromobacter xylosoxidans]RPJ89934.1 lipopolysaccharide assembly protein LapB [Achromobacter xylosoxidans]